MAEKEFSRRELLRHTGQVTLIVGSTHVVATLLAGCDSSDDSEPMAANPAFNGTFSGNITLTKGGQNVVNAATATLTVMSPLSGTLQVSNSFIGTISGKAEGNTAQFTVTIGGACPGTFSGSINLSDTQTLSIQGNGSDCQGPFSVTGTLLAGTPSPGGTYSSGYGYYYGYYGSSASIQSIRHIRTE